MGVVSYKDLVVWQRVMDLMVAVYRLTKRFPSHEIYALTNQLRRAAVSIPSNVAEGQGRSTTREFLHFLSMANGSMKEVETQVLIAQRLEYVTCEDSAPVLKLLTELGRLISGLTASLKRNRKKP